MIRAFHRWPGLLALALLIILALSGAALSLFPAAERLAAPQGEAGLTVADLAARIQAVYPGVEQIQRAPSGRITAYWFDQGAPGAAVIDPATGKGLAPAEPNAAERWLTNLHRSLFLGDTGRIVTASAALALLALALSGVGLVARRAGGWRQWFRPLRGARAGRLHVEIARVAVMGLALSSLTALWMTASTFGLLPDEAGPPEPTVEVSGKRGAALATMPLLQAMPVGALRELNFPYPDDATDVFTLKTADGIGLIDQGSGGTLAWTGRTAWQGVSDTIQMLHTGQGAALFGLVMGAMALALPLMGVTGLSIWLGRWRNRPRIPGNQPAERADTILLVGSEGGSTWGFAAALHKALTGAGHSVHVAPMLAFAPKRYGRAERIILLAATYGNGDAPASARGFLDQFAASAGLRQVPLAVLGFGDRSFPAYCAFAERVDDLAEMMGWPKLLPLDCVDRQSPQDFARWGQALGQALGVNLELAHRQIKPQMQGLTLASRRDYGAEVQAAMAILRFAPPRITLWQRLMGQGFARFRAGDLLGILPQGSTVPRLYSLASGWRDGFVEIVVKKHPGGLCSGQLMALQPGDTVTAFLRRNPGFQPGRGRRPLILIGAGTGIGPLAGFIRSNLRRRSLHLFFGMRHPASDFLYDTDISAWRASGQLSTLVTAASRGARPHYVQDALRTEGAEVARLIGLGARIMVCGGRDMANGVTEAMVDILAPIGMTPAMLKAQGRYVEDVY